MNDKQLMINKLLSNSFINIQDINSEEIIEFDLFNKLKQLGSTNSDSWKHIVINNIKRIKYTNNDEEYIAFVIKEDLRLTFQYRGTIQELKEKYNLINFEMIDKLLDYKNNKIEVKDLISFITNK